MGVLKSKNIDYTGVVPVDTSFGSASTNAVQNKVITNTLGVVESGDYAANSHAVGSVFLWKDKIVKVTTAISANTHIVLKPASGYNVESTDIVDVLNTFNSKLTGLTANINGIKVLKSSGNLTTNAAGEGMIDFSPVGSITDLNKAVAILTPNTATPFWFAPSLASLSTLYGISNGGNQSFWIDFVIIYWD